VVSGAAGMGLAAAVLSYPGLLRPYSYRFRYSAMDSDLSAAPAPGSAEAGAALLARFAHRVATRDEPPAPLPHAYDQAALEARIADALRAEQPRLRRNRALSQARLCYALMQHPRLMTRELAAAAGVTRLTVYRVFPELQRRRLAAEESGGGRNYHFLTRAGEDWLLEVTR
jgi:hypothetical protein